MQVNFSFSRTRDQRLLITLEVIAGNGCLNSDAFAAKAFEDENSFLASVIQAELPPDGSAELIVAAIRAMQHDQPSLWIPADLSHEQLHALGFVCPPPQPAPTPPPFSTPPGRPFGDASLEQVLLGSPAPFAVVTGPQHASTS
jgi:hypothetical protein